MPSDQRLIRTSSSEVKPHDENGIHPARLQRESYGQQQSILVGGADAETGALLLVGLRAAIPDGAGVIERLEPTPAVLDRAVHDTVAAQGSDIKLVPAAECRSVAEHETLKQRRLSADRAG